MDNSSIKSYSLPSLNSKQKRFCDEYLVDHNATRAAKRAGYSKNTADSQGARLLKNAGVKVYLAGKAQKLEKKLEISAERTLIEIARIAYGDVRQFYDEEGKLIPVHKLSDEAAASISGIDLEEMKEDGIVVGYLKKIRRFDKNPALDKLAKHFKLYVDAPAPPVNINLNNLSALELKALLAVMKKMAG